MTDRKMKNKMKVVIKKVTETRAQIQKSSYILNIKYVTKYTNNSTNKVNNIVSKTDQLKKKKSWKDEQQIKEQ